MRTKRKFITIKPKTSQAKLFFESSMLGLQSCELLEIRDNNYLLRPIRTQKCFWMKFKEDENWEIEK
jgi:hypothetical protein